MQKIKLHREPCLDIKKDAFPFQNDAVDFVLDKEYSAIFYEQGLGKTKIAIDVIVNWLANKEVDTIFIVTKKGLVHNWIEEFEIHSYIKPKVLSSNKRNNFHVLNSPARVIVANFEALMSEYDRLQYYLRIHNSAIIVDESAKLKNPESKLTKTYFKLSNKFKKRIIMTGTPVSNRPQDIWAQIYFLDQGKNLGSDYEKFCKDVNLDNNLYKDKNRQEFFEHRLVEIFPKISNFCIRETKNGSGLELPGKYFENIICEWEPQQEKLYDDVKAQEKYAFIRDGDVSVEDSEVTIKRLTRLLQVASNPALINESYRQMPGKYSYLVQLLRDITSKNEKCIVWTNYVNNSEWLISKLHDYNPVLIHGGVDTNGRNKAVDIFKNDDSCKVLVAVPAAAKEGLTLTVANNVIFWDRSLSLDDYLQSQDRIHRISQEKDCYIYNLIMENSIDVWVDSLLNAKSLSAKLVQEDVSATEFKEEINYSFGELVHDVLGLKEE